MTRQKAKPGTSTAKEGTGGPTRSSQAGWTPEQDECLINAVNLNDRKNWKKIAELVPGRDHSECNSRWQKVLNPELNKTHWTEEEDGLLKSAVEEALTNFESLSDAKWATEIAPHVPGRTSKQCRERWTNNLDPKLSHEPWSEDEELRLLEKHEDIGNHWAEMRGFFPNRSDNNIKNKWNSIKGRWENGVRDTFDPTNPCSRVFKYFYEYEIREREKGNTLCAPQKVDRGMKGRRRGNPSTSGCVAVEDQEEATQEETGNENLDLNQTIDSGLPEDLNPEESAAINVPVDASGEAVYSNAMLFNQHQFPPLPSGPVTFVPKSYPHPSDIPIAPIFNPFEFEASHSQLPLPFGLQAAAQEEARMMAASEVLPMDEAGGHREASLYLDFSQGEAAQPNPVQNHSDEQNVQAPDMAAPFGTTAGTTSMPDMDYNNGSELSPLRDQVQTDLNEMQTPVKSDFAEVPGSNVTPFSATKLLSQGGSQRLGSEFGYSLTPLQSSIDRSIQFPDAVSSAEVKAFLEDSPAAKAKKKQRLRETRYNLDAFNSTVPPEGDQEQSCSKRSRRALTFDGDEGSKAEKRQCLPTDTHSGEQDIPAPANESFAAELCETSHLEDENIQAQDMVTPLYSTPTMDLSYYEDLPDSSLTPFSATKFLLQEGPLHGSEFGFNTTPPQGSIDRSVQFPEEVPSGEVKAFLEDSPAVKAKKKQRMRETRYNLDAFNSNAPPEGEEKEETSSKRSRRTLCFDDDAGLQAEKRQCVPTEPQTGEGDIPQTGTEVCAGEVCKTELAGTDLSETEVSEIALVKK